MDYLLEALATAFVLILALYGAFFDPPESRVLRWFAATVSILAGIWLVIVLGVAATPTPA